MIRISVILTHVWNFAARGVHSLLWPEITAFLSHEAIIRGQRPPQLHVARFQNIVYRRLIQLALQLLITTTTIAPGFHVRIKSPDSYQIPYWVKNMKIQLNACIHINFVAYWCKCWCLYMYIHTRLTMNYVILVYLINK